MELNRIGDALWEVPPHGAMRVPARLVASEDLLRQAHADNALQQLVNVACLPGIVTAALAMPDIHWGYGFPIGGVAAFDAEEGIVSPGGVGYDINCGVRLLATALERREIAARLPALAAALFNAVPAGVGSTGSLRLSARELRQAAVGGAAWAVRRGFGTEADLDRIEEGGCLAGADPEAVSAEAVRRGLSQVGTLGAGNHFLELQAVEEILDPGAAAVFGLRPDQVLLSIHCGSRGYGHQVCDDSLAAMDRAAARYGIVLPDRQLACAPLASPEGRAYLGAMRCAVNIAFANRQAIAHLAGEALARALAQPPAALQLRTVYEVAHNIAKLETHTVDGRPRRLCVHRKGATRAFGPGHPDVPSAYRGVGQPVLVPGDMGRCSYVLAGTDGAMRTTFGSACHGAGRAMSRHAARRAARSRDVIGELRERGIAVMAQSRATAAEEMPEAYKDVSRVVDACTRAGIARPVARLVPLACIKG